ncbi:hypothetical protein L1987_74851 [Smallanthus sonchifolius]|uniref:Uncharacterized protein n=1 Tax=Smallanthus sonchifolius TaxID=185202 RepID=A0ACB9A4U7_9ASTR|nr:hypothetical protein L1987_74851 [Smallanthus sonchifolius]
MAAYAMIITDPLIFSPLYNLNRSIEEGGTAAFKTFGVSTWDLFCGNPQANKGFNDGMACLTRIDMDAIMSCYDFGSLEGTLVDVGGGVGVALSEKQDIHILKVLTLTSLMLFHMHQHMKELHMLEVTCLQTFPREIHSLSRNGKVIIVDIVLSQEGDDVFDEARISMDMLMLTYFDGAKERTEVDWKRILEEAGFHRYNIIKIPVPVSIVEAYIE